MNGIPEKDWKLLRAMQEEKLAFVCDQILRRVEGIIQERNGKEHEAFLQVWSKIQEGNAEVALMFDDIRRSNAILKLIAWRKNGLLNDEELGLFSAPTQEVIARAGTSMR